MDRRKLPQIAKPDHKQNRVLAKNLPSSGEDDTRMKTAGDRCRLAMAPRQ